MGGEITSLWLRGDDYDLNRQRQAEQRNALPRAVRFLGQSGVLHEVRVVNQDVTIIIVGALKRPKTRHKSYEAGQGESWTTVENLAIVIQQQNDTPLLFVDSLA